MAITYNYRKGVDLPSWHWLNQFTPGSSQPGSACQYDGSRYIYWAIQFGSSTAGTAATSQLFRFDTWTDSWQFLATLISGNQGMDIEYDATRNVVYVMTGALLTSWQVFNLNTTAVTIANVSCAAWAITTMTPILPATSSVGASFTQPDDHSVPTVIETDTANGGTTTTVTTAANTFTPGMVGLQINFASNTTTVALQSKYHIISAVNSATQITVTGTMAGTPVLGDTFTVTMPTGTSTGTNSSTTLNDTTATNPWATNQYANHDVIILSGTGSGQRRRIGSNTSTALTLASAVTGSSVATGSWSVTPDATSVYRIVPSADFLYFQNGNTTATMWKIDLSQTTGVAWAALTAVPATVAGGGNTVYPQYTSPSFILCLRGSVTAQYYWYNIGTNAWVTPTVFPGGETFNTGASSCLIHGKKKLLIQKEATNRLYVYDLTTGMLDSFGTTPYAAPSAGDGKRAHYVKTSDGVEFLYILRAGGQEYFRVPIEWL